MDAIAGEKSLGSQGFIFATFPKEISDLGGPYSTLIELKKGEVGCCRRRWDYIPPVDWNRAKVFPSGYLRTAKYPIGGICCFAVMVWAPRLAALAEDSSTELAEMELRNCSFGALRLKSPPMVSLAGASLWAMSQYSCS